MESPESCPQHKICFVVLAARGNDADVIEGVVLFFLNCQIADSIVDSMLILP
jgi:hypothetical protein